MIDQYAMNCNWLRIFTVVQPVLFMFRLSFKRPTVDQSLASQHRLVQSAYIEDAIGPSDHEIRSEA